MNKRREMKHDDINDPKFATSVHWGKEPLSEKELMRILENDHTIYRKFTRNGYITSREYSFITRTTFCEKKTSELAADDKTQAQKEQAIKMRKIVEDCLERSIKVEFAFRGDGECALFDGNRFNSQEINMKLKEEFN